MECRGKAALVTGGGGGIGSALCKALAGAGAAVAVNDIVAARAQAVVDEIAGAGGRSVALAADATLPGDARHMVRSTVESFGALDILVTCAGTYGRRAYLDEMRDGEWHEVMTSLLYSTLYVLQAAIPQMKHQRSGRIVTFSSTVGTTGMPGASHHAAAKAAVENLTRSAALELAPYGVTVNCISPSYTDTDFLNTAYAPDLRQRMAGVIPLGRMGRPKDLVGPVLLLAGPGGDFITGEVLHVDGGRRLSLTRPWT